MFLLVRRLNVSSILDFSNHGPVASSNIHNSCKTHCENIKVSICPNERRRTKELSKLSRVPRKYSTLWLLFSVETLSRTRKICPITQINTHLTGQGLPGYQEVPALLLANRDVSDFNFHLFGRMNQPFQQLPTRK